MGFKLDIIHSYLLNPKARPKFFPTIIHRLHSPFLINGSEVCLFNSPLSKNLLMTLIFSFMSVF